MKLKQKQQKRFARVQPMHQPRPNNRRGAALILVVSLMVLLVTLGVAYLQVAMLDAASNKYVQDQNLAKKIVIAESQLIMGDLRDDLLDSQGFLLNPAPADPTEPGDEMYDYPWRNTANTVRNTRTVNTPLSPAAGYTVLGGSDDDMWLSVSSPTWAAGTASSVVPEYLHISALDHVYVVPPALGSTSKLPLEFEIGPATPNAAAVAHPWLFDNMNLQYDAAATTPASQTAAPWGLHSQPPIDRNNNAVAAGVYETVGEDADGNGIFDARWKWSVVPQSGSRQFIVLTKVIDLSSRINFEIATSLTGDGSTLQALPDAPRGFNPSELDLSRLLSRTGNAGWAGELDTQVSNRSIYDGTYTIGTPTLVGTGTEYTLIDRETIWLGRGIFSGYSALFPDRVADTLEMLYKGGLNRDDRTTTIEGYMPTVMRSAAAAEVDYKTLDYAAYYTTAPDTDREKLLAWHQGSENAADPSTVSMLTARVYPNARMFLTGISGANRYASNHNNINAGNAVAPYDLSLEMASLPGTTYDPGTPDSVSKLFAYIYGALSIADSSANGYDGIAVGDPQLAELSMMYALNLYDYQDTATAGPDFPTAYHFNKAAPGSASAATDVRYAGIEALPFIREVYLQIGYDDVNANGNNGTGRTDQWQRVDNSVAMAIEVANPFDRPIDLTDGQIRVRIVDNTTGTPTVVGTPFHVIGSGGTWSNFAIANTLAANDMTVTTEEHSAIIYANSADPQIEQDGSGPGADLATDLGFGTALEQTIQAADGTFLIPLPTGAGTIDLADVTVELQAWVGANGSTPDNLSTTDWITYDRFALEGTIDTSDTSVPETLDHNNAGPQNATTPITYKTHVQASYARDGRFKRFISNENLSTLKFKGMPGPAYNAFSAPIPYDISEHSFGQDQKEIGDGTGTYVTGHANMDDGSLYPHPFNIPLADRPFVSVPEAAWVMMLGFTDEVTGDFPQRFDAAWTSATRGKLWLDQTSIPDTTGVPYLAMLLDQFIVNGPMEDGLDNDNDDGDNEPDPTAVGPPSGAVGVDNGDFFIPGTININTATLPALALPAPLPEAIADSQPLMETIIAYRDYPSLRPSGTVGNLSRIASPRTAPGIASISELYYVYVEGGAITQDMQAWGVDGANNHTTTTPDPSRELYPDHEMQAAGIVNITDDTDSPEEKLNRLYHMTQTFSTRSDIYAAYITVRGYPAGDFSKGVVDSARAVVIFDRSSVTSDSDEVQILAIEFFE